MTKQDNKVSLAMAMFDVLEALYDSDVNTPLAVVSIVRGHMLAFKEQDGEEKAAPAKPKQRRARRKKSDKPDMEMLAATN